MKLVKIWKNISLMFFNIVVILVVFNLLLAAMLHVKTYFFGKNKIGPMRKYSIEQLEKAYNGKTHEEIVGILKESWSRQMWHYIPDREWGEKEFSGKYLNVSEVGYRNINRQAAWPPPEDDFNIFVFGGSTTFGFGVADGETIPSYLQDFILEDTLDKKVNVYNFGQGSYFSVKERIFFEELLLSGHKPDLVIFIDGLNDLYEENTPNKLSSHSLQLSKLVVSTNIDKLKIILYDAPMVYVAERLSIKLFNNGKEAPPPPRDNEDAGMFIKRYLTNKGIINGIADFYDIKTLFVWQPIPQYASNPELYLFHEALNNADFYVRGYDIMKEKNKFDPSLNEDFLWLADIQKDQKYQLYVDGVHYTPEFSKEIAKNIYNSLVEKKLLN